MRDIVLRLTVIEANMLRLLAEHAVRNIEKDRDEERKQALLPTSRAVIAKLRKPLKDRKVI